MSLFMFNRVRKELLEHRAQVDHPVLWSVLNTILSHTLKLFPCDLSLQAEFSPNIQANTNVLL